MAKLIDTMSVASLIQNLTMEGRVTLLQAVMQASEDIYDNFPSEVTEHYKQLKQEIQDAI